MCCTCSKLEDNGELEIERSSRVDYKADGLVHRLPPSEMVHGVQVSAVAD